MTTERVFYPQHLCAYPVRKQKKSTNLKSAHVRLDEIVTALWRANLLTKVGSRARAHRLLDHMARRKPRIKVTQIAVPFGGCAPGQTVSTGNAIFPVRSETVIRSRSTK